MTYHVQFAPQALEDLSQLDTPIAKRVAEKLQWLAEHFDQIQPETLTGPFASLFKLRVGDWRVLYTTDPAQRGAWHLARCGTLTTALRNTTLRRYGFLVPSDLVGSH